MCGIVGYIGDGDAREIIIDGLKKLEYRGYDSSGLAVILCAAGHRLLHHQPFSARRTGRRGGRDVGTVNL